MAVLAGRHPPQGQQVFWPVLEDRECAGEGMHLFAVGLYNPVPLDSCYCWVRWGEEGWTTRPPKVVPRPSVPGLGHLQELHFLLKINMGSGDPIHRPQGFNSGFMFALGMLIRAALCWGQERCSQGSFLWGH